MKALVKRHAREGLWLEELPIPRILPHEVLIRVDRTGICGTDLHIHEWDAWAQKTIPLPLVIGHEFVGTIEEVGSEVETGVAPGDLVSGEGHLVCGQCRNCLAGRRHLCGNTEGLGIHRPGAFAEYVSLPASNVWVHQNRSLDRNVAACFDPLGNAVHTALSFPILGEDVLITGAGPIGLMALSVARQAGARHIVVTDLNPFRRAMAKRGGATLAVDPSVTGLAEVQRDLGMAEGFDVGLEMSGSGQALSQMIQAMVPGGKIALLGIPAEAYPIPWEKIVFRMLTLKGIYGREMFETWYQASVLVEQGLAISSLITHHFAAEDHEQAFDIMSAGRSGKVILHWQPFDSNSLAA